MKEKLIFIFLDGVGLGKNEGANPFTKAYMPVLTNLLGKRLLETTHRIRQNLLVKGIDACLGVEGIPQSATGQTSLFTGFNSQSVFGYHLTAYPNPELVKLINTRSILKYAEERHITSTFANSYSDSFFKKVDVSTYSVTTHCVLAAGLPFKTIRDLMENKAVHWDINNSTLPEYTDENVPVIFPFNAGQNLSKLTDDYDLILYECFLPDLIGHKRDMDKSVWFLEMFDEFLKGVLHKAIANTTILITSDHGNIEDLTTGGHTRNMVPLVVIGKQAPNFSGVNSIDQIFNAIFQFLFKV